MNYREMILGQLLTKYENSAHFQRTAKINRRLTFTFDKNSLPAYAAGEEPQVKEAVHQVIEDLRQKGILEVEWVRGEKNNLLKRVSLNLEKVEEAYRLIGRTPKRAQLAEIDECIQVYKEQMVAPWLQDFLNHCQGVIRERLVFPPALPAEKADLVLLLKALKGLEKKGEEELLERVFSLKYLGDSKLFSQKVRSYLVNIARSHYLWDPDLSDEDVLYELGIVKTSEEILLAGPLAINLQGQRIDLTPLAFGAVIDTQMINDVEIQQVLAGKVLLVENKTNFHHLVRKGLPPDLLLIYLGGFPGPRKRKFLTMLADFFRQEEKTGRFYHWGDLDWGGLRIFQLLQEKVLPGLQPLYMDEKTLLAYQDYGETLNPVYRKRLEKLGQSPQYAVFHGLISLMLELNIKLEQEALLIDDNFRLEL